MKSFSKIKKYAKYIFMVIIINIVIGCFYSIPMVYYGPFKNIREMLVTTAMSTMTHQYIATFFLSDEEINRILNKNKVNDNGESHSSDIQVATTAAKVTDPREGIESIKIDKGNLHGNMLIIKDSKRIKLGISKDIGKFGEKLDDMCNRYGAIAGINAGGFLDDNGQGNGGTPTGIVVENGKVVFKDPQITDEPINTIGFSSKGILSLGKYKFSQIDSKLEENDIHDAISFSPFLILNGEPTITKGNGGGGINPRTVIGQRKDGAVIFLVIDGRQSFSLGATLKEVQNIMLEYGAYNAANLDGGSSTTMYYDGKIMNNPCSSDGIRFITTAFLVE